MAITALNNPMVNSIDDVIMMVAEIQRDMLGKCTVVLSVYNNKAVSIGVYNDNPRMWNLHSCMELSEIQAIAKDIADFFGKTII